MKNIPIVMLCTVGAALYGCATANDAFEEDTGTETFEDSETITEPEDTGSDGPTDSDGGADSESETASATEVASESESETGSATEVASESESESETGSGTETSSDPGTCVDVEVPAPAAAEPLDPVLPAGPVETTAVDGFTDDYLYDATSYLKVGTRREWGASIIFYGLANGSPGVNGTNVIDANDTGREVQIALYDPSMSMQNCAWNQSCLSTPTDCANSITYLGWNPVQGGNECVHGSGVEGVSVVPGTLTATVRPLFWNPDWQATDCVNTGCADGTLSWLESDVLYTQRLRFVMSNIVEMQMTVQNLTTVEHAPTLQEFPTVYASYGAAGTQDYNLLLDSAGNQIAIDQPANDGFFYKNFDSADGFVALQKSGLDYGVGIYYENRLTTFQGWQKAGVFNNVRARFTFGLAASGSVQARAYLLLGSYATVAALADTLDGALAPFGVLDAPAPEATATGTLDIFGWVLDNRGVSAVDAWLDGEFFAALDLGEPRADVCKVWPGYADCPNVGYSGSLSLATVPRCAHLLEIVATDTDGNERVISRSRVFVN